MKTYISPLAETVKLSIEDVIATSSYTTEEGENWWVSAPLGC